MTFSLGRLHVYKYVQSRWTEVRGAKWGMPLESHVPRFQERVDTGRLK
jgi:hypothetical protein